MPFTSLSNEAQNLIMVNFEFFGKRLILGFVLIFSIFYVFYWRKKQTETPFFFVAYLRTILYLMSYIFLWISPFFLLALYPQVSLDWFINLILLFYGVGFILFGIVVLVNVMFIGPMFLLRFGGLSVFETKTDRIMRALFGKKRANQIIRELPKWKKPQVKMHE